MHNPPQDDTVLPLPPTNRLSPKNQVTLPRDAAALAGVERVRALAHWMPGKAERQQRSPVVVLMTEAELRRRERLIIEAPNLSPADKLVHVQDLNAGAVQLNVDEQRRVVLPQHLIDYLGLQRDILFVAAGDKVFAWNPDEFQRWNNPQQPATTDLTQFLV